MNYALGYGLPSTLTPDRIRNVLDLAESHKRLLGNELARGDHPAWRRTASGPAGRSRAAGFYARLQGLLRSAEGRIAYQRAVEAFESRKSKLGGRANIFFKLLKPYIGDRVVEGNLPDSENEISGMVDDIAEALATEGAWEKLSEVLWLGAILSRSAGRLRACMDRYPDVQPYLEDVAAGLVPLEAGQENPPDPVPSGKSPETAAAAVLSAVENLDRESLGPSDVQALDAAAKRLASIVEAHRGVLERALEHLDAWQSEQADAVSAVDAMDGRISRLRASVENGDIGEERLETILSDFDRVLDLETSIADNLKTCQDVLAAKNFSKLSDISRQLKTQESERLDLYAKIDEACNARTVEPESSDDTTVGDDDSGPKSATDDDPAAEDDPTPEASSPEPGGGDAAAASPEIAPSRPPRQETSGDAPALAVPEPELPPSPGGDGGESAAAGDGGEEEDEPDDGSPATGGADPAPGAADAVEDDPIDSAIATAMNRRLFGVAYHLARAEPNAALGPDIVKLAASNYAADANDIAVTDLPKIADAVRTQIEEAPEVEPDHAALVCGITLFPSLLAPGGPVEQLLSAMVRRLSDMPSLQALAREAAEVSRAGVHLPPESFRAEDPLAEWRESAVALQKEAEQWLDSEGRTTIRYQAGTRVWRRMLERWKDDDSRDSIRDMVGMLRTPAASIDIGKIEKAARHWRDKGDDEIDRVDRELRRKAGIVGAARKNILAKIDDAVALVDRWSALIARRPNRAPDFIARQAARLRSAAGEHARQALVETGRLGTAKAEFASEAIRRYAAMFDSAANGEPPPRMKFRDLLHGDLLANPDITFDESGEAIDDPVDPQLVLPILRDEKMDFGAAAIVRAEKRDFRGAEMALDFGLGKNRIADADGVREKIDVRRSAAQGDLQQRLDETSGRLDSAYARGIVSLQTLETLRERLPSAEMSHADDFTRRFAALDAIEREVAQFDAIRRKTVEDELQEIGAISAEHRELIEHALDNGQFQVAEDYMERIRSGGDLPASGNNRPGAFDAFFPGAVDEYMKFRESTGDAAERIEFAVRVIRQSRREGPVDGSKLTKAAANGGVGILKAWDSLHGRSLGNERLYKRLRTLMSAIGFAAPRIEGAREGSGMEGIEEYVMRCESAPEPAAALLPDFGSRAGGRYRLFLVRGRASHEAAIRCARRHGADGEAPNIVLFLEALDAQSRRALARAFHPGAHRPTLVLDEALVVFLASRNGNRLAAFFECTIPFAFSQPYEPDAPRVPPEMFFGRESERARIIATTGDMTHLVYGGRRLGKTALLEDIVREFRSRAPDRLALFINLKGKGIGENRQPREIWREFAAELKREKVIRASLSAHDSMSEAILKWLDDKRGRRILIMVDEADAFLTGDRTGGYRELERIKQLMERTDRRFKAVFAGLHNVQRAARDPNTPFAHLGEALRVGPLLPETDGNAVERLVRGPLEALGYRFESPESVVRIAAETNYYPSLVQQFCKELLLHLRQGTTADGPPWQISRETVDRVFEAKETRDRIRTMFSLTIQLDPRYEFLTYLIAGESFEQESRQPQGVPVVDIRDLALREWQEGFSDDSSNWMFEVLLEEMQGLGIVRETVAKRNGKDMLAYAIRSRNLRMLIGNDDEIRRRFEDAKGNLPPARFEAAQFREDLPDRVPSPLTAGQRERLLSRGKSVGLVLGARLSGLDRVREEFEREAERAGTEEYRSVRLRGAGVDELSAALERASRNKTRGVEVVMVDMRRTWRPEKIGEAVAFVRRGAGEMRIVRPIFVLGPAEAWEWVHGGDRPARSPDVEIAEVWLGPCSRDFARTRLLESPMHAELEKADSSIDLPWPAAVAEARGDRRPESMEDAIRAVAENSGLFSDLTPNAVAATAFRVMLAYDDPLTADEISTLSSDVEGGDPMSPESAERFLDWANRLGMALVSAKNNRHGYRLDAACAAGLAAAFSR